MKKPVIEIRNLKVARFASQETLCFACTVYVDGKKAGVGENDGHGGGSLYHFDTPEIRTRLTAYVASLPPEISDTLKDPNDRTKPFVHKQRLDDWLDEFVYDLDQKKYEDRQKKSFEKKCKTKSLVRILGVAYPAMSYTQFSCPYDDRMVAHLEKNYPQGWKRIVSLNQILEPQEAAK